MYGSQGGDIESQQQQPTQQQPGTMIVRGAGRLCGQPPTTRCCCFELRMGLIIFPGLLLADIFVTEVLYSIDLSRASTEKGPDASSGASHPLMGLAALHFLISFYFTVLGLIGTIKYRAPLLRPAYKFAPVSALFTMLFGIIEVHVQRLANPDLPLMNGYQTLIAYGFSAALDLWYGYAMW
jgi:hypothetical protein